jgi:hypothetical protein
MSAQPQQAAKEILGGEPQAAARRWLGPAALVMFVLFAIDTYLVVNGALTSIDIPIATFVQSVNWGPIVYVFDLINISAGYWQVLIGLVAIVALFIVERRAGWLMLIGSISSLLDNIIKLLVSRARPTVDLVHILTPASGFSYPSGDELHAGRLPGAADQTRLPATAVGVGAARDRAHVPGQGVGRRPLAQRRHRRCAARRRLVGICAVAAGKMAALAQHEVVREGH